MQASCAHIRPSITPLVFSLNFLPCDLHLSYVETGLPYLSPLDALSQQAYRAGIQECITCTLEIQIEEKKVN